MAHRERPDSRPPPGSWLPALRVLRGLRRPVDAFLAIEAASGLLLMLAAAIALAWANSDWSASYTELWHTPIGLRVGSFAFERDLMLERQREGIAKAKSEGKYKGRAPTARRKAADVVRLKAEGRTGDAIAAQLGIGRASVFRILRDAASATATAR